MDAWSKMKHKNILHFVGFMIEKGGWISLVAPWQANGTANEFLKGKSWKIAMNVVRISLFNSEIAPHRLMKDHWSMPWTEILTF